MILNAATFAAHQVRTGISMSFEPLWAAPGMIPSHALAAMAAFVLGVAQLALPKGTFPHRIMGYCWAALMAVIAGSSLFIHRINPPDGFSWIHLLSVYVLVVLPLAIWNARRGNIASHARSMGLMFAGALVVAGAFTFLPGRIMHQVMFGQ
jgi:uncharacterized membrane protein